MDFEFNIMTQEQAEIIAFNWHYEGEYSFYNMEADEEDLEEFLNREKRGNTTFAINDNGELVAFLSVRKVSSRVVDIGLGMRPDLTGKGKGRDFLIACINFLQSQFQPEKITLSVASFNQRAIKLYRKVGFKDVRTFIQNTNGGKYEFLEMEYEC